MCTREVILQAFVRSYIGAMLWSSTDGPEGQEEPLDASYDSSDVHPASMAGAQSECADFVNANFPDLEKYVERVGRSEEYTGWERAGHDFWLTRNGHGVGYWDRGLGELGRKLSDAAKVYGGRDPYVGDDGKIHISGLENFNATQ